MFPLPHRSIQGKIAMSSPSSRRRERIASAANLLMWAPMAILAMQLLSLALLQMLGYRLLGNNTLAYASLSLTASGLLTGMLALPFADRPGWPLRLLLAPTWLLVARLSMIASGF